jgi:hypothetical protein
MKKSFIAWRWENHAQVCHCCCWLFLLQVKKTQWAFFLSSSSSSNPDLQSIWEEFLFLANRFELLHA